MQVVILCGGRGTRIRDVADDIPKPMIPIGGRPIVWHLMKGLAHHGLTEFILCLGYKSEVIKRYFLDYPLMYCDLSLELGQRERSWLHGAAGAENWHITLAETGPETQTGGRIKRIEKYLTGETFLLTYGDGLADLDIPELLAFHRRHGKLATVTAVRTPGRYGELDLDGSRVVAFDEKPSRSPGWINGGFFVLQRHVLERLRDDPGVAFEQEPLRQLAAEGELGAYRHDGFWQAMDTPREHQLLNDLWNQDHAPWKTWDQPMAARPRAEPAPVPRPRHGFWRDRRVFVTGCTGLVGSWAVRELLRRGAHVVGLVRDHIAGSPLLRKGPRGRIDVVFGRVEDQPLLERILAEYEIQTIFHLAAQTIVGIANRSPLSTFETNVRGTWCLLEAARRCGANPHVLIASSDKAYGDQGVLPCREDAPLRARHPYDVSKSCADLLAASYFHTYNLPVCVTRCGNLYGGGDLNWNRIVPGTIRSVLRGQRPVIRSDGRHVRDFLYVKDAASAYLHLAECLAAQPDLAGEAFNFSAETPLTVLELVQRILERMWSDLEPDVRGEASHEIPRQTLSATKARRLLGWAPEYALDEGLAETIAWYRDHLARGERNPPRQRRRTVPTA